MGQKEVVQAKRKIQSFSERFSGQIQNHTTIDNVMSSLTKLGNPGIVIRRITHSL